MGSKLSYDVDTGLNYTMNGKLYCCVCNIEINSKNHGGETAHLLQMNYFSQYFIDKSEDSIECKVCSKNISKYDVNEHAIQHKLIPWYRPKNEFQKYFTNFIALNNNAYSCWVCRKEVKYWFQAVSHCTDPEHLLQMAKIDKEIFNTSLTFDLYEQYVRHRIYPHSINTADCYVCDLTVDYKNIKEHILSKNHQLLILKQADNNLLSEITTTELYLQYFKNFIGILKKGNHFCYLCKYLFSEWDKAERHIESPEHQSALKTSVDEKNIDTSLSLNFYRKCVQHSIVPKSFNELKCMMCNCCIPGYQNLNEHILGKNHKKMNEESNFSPSSLHCNNIDNKQIEKPIIAYNRCFINFIGIIENTYWCFICHAKFEPKNLVIPHLQSSIHQTNVTDFIDVKSRKLRLAQNLYKNCVQQGIFSISLDVAKCFICNCIISLYSSMREHSTGRRHKTQYLAWKTMINSNDKGKIITTLKSRALKNKTVNSKTGILNSAKNKSVNDTKNKTDDGCISIDSIDNQAKIKDSSSKTTKFILKSYKKSGSKKSSNFNHKTAVKNKKMKEKLDKPILQQTSKNNSSQVFTQRGSFICIICNNLKLYSEKILHIHLTSHFLPRFLQQDDCQEIDINASSQHYQPDTLSIAGINNSNDVKITPSDRELGDFNPCKIPSNIPNYVLISENKYENSKNLVKAADISSDEVRTMNIYEIDSIQLEMMDLSITRFYLCDENNIYCLICREKISYSVITVFEHFRSIHHNDYLLQMIQDHIKSISFPDQLSDLSLTRECMEDISDDFIKCYGCQEIIKNNALSLMDHLNEKNHIYQRSQILLKINNFVESLYLTMERNWYKAIRYWCVPCCKNYILENEFYEHLYVSGKNNEHLNQCQRFSEFTSFILDYCPTCKTLFYGFRNTFAYHCEIEKHQYFVKQPFYYVNQLPSAVEEMLSEPDSMINETIKLLDSKAQKRLKDENLMIKDLERILNRSTSAKAYAFGSRVNGLSSETSDFDIFLDYGDRYYSGKRTDDVSHILGQVEKYLKSCSSIWIINRTITNCRVPIIKVTYKPLNIECDISVQNGLAIESSQLIKTINQKLPLCRKLILFVKQWINGCNLSGEKGITNYAVTWMVIYYLQTKSLIKPIITLIKDRNESKIIDGWETGASLDFLIPESKESFKDCLKGFFEMITTFDFRNNIICPFFGKPLEKICFSDPVKLLPEEMETYKQHSERENHEPFHIVTPLCVQDPYNLSNNITKATKKITLLKFITLSALTLKKLDNDNARLDEI